MRHANIELHVHPFMGTNTIRDVANAMDQTSIDIVALEALDDTIYPQVIEEAKKFYDDLEIDRAGVKLPDGKFLLNAREYNTRENLHVLTIGHSVDATPETEICEIIDNALENDALVLIDHAYVDNNRTKTAGHISPALEDAVESMCKAYSGEIAIEWNGYCIPWMRKGLQMFINTTKLAKVDYHDVNKKAEELSERLEKQGYNVPIVADTDLHARSRFDLLWMGTSRLITDVDGESASEIVKSMKEKIFKREYENVKEYVSSAHLLKAFCLPILFPSLFKNPRGENDNRR